MMKNARFFALPPDADGRGAMPRLSNRFFYEKECKDYKKNDIATNVIGFARLVLCLILNIVVALHCLTESRSFRRA